ncbi:helix-turn-helix domain-containing protein [Rathayibacter soli]|uniref:helix-turn-helix domain-containing protein n=1 Tax=Rathayibacter soli TaxID=3144168 RepID=UPI0027E46D3E|nr:helix-turn-helix domain-containing protein [Glaciibacter superstes]
MALQAPHTAPAPDAEHAAKLRNALSRVAASADALTLQVGNANVELPASVRDAIVDVLQRFAAGDSVVIGSVEALLTTSQAADMIGISHTYLLRLADAGKLPVQYRGTHRRFAVADVVAYLESASHARS